MKQLFLSLFIAVIAMDAHCAELKGNIVPEHVFVSTVKSEIKKNPQDLFFRAERLKDTVIDPIGAVATFRFVVRNAIPDQKYLLSSQNLGGPVQFLYEYEADDEGHLGRQVQDGTMMMDNDNLLMFDFFKGQSIQYFLEPKDRSMKFTTTLIPYPIRAEARDGAEVTLRRMTQDAKLMICEGDGFLPDEEILISSQSGRERTKSVSFVCEDGEFSVLLEPQVVGKSGGLAYVDIRRITGERIILEYDWGSQATNLKKRQADSSKIKLDALSKIPTALDD